MIIEEIREEYDNFMHQCINYRQQYPSYVEWVEQQLLKAREENEDLKAIIEFLKYDLNNETCK